MNFPKIAVVDIEATGPNYLEGDRMIQIAAVIIQEGKIIETHEMLLNPKREVPDRIVQLTHLDPKEIALSQTFDEVAEFWKNVLSDTILVAHHLAFDYGILKHAFEAVGLTCEFKYLIDTLELSKILFPEATGYNLSQLSQDLSIELTHAHHAKYDTMATVELLNALSNQVKKLNSTTQKNLQRMGRYLNYDNDYFFKYPQYFCVEGLLNKAVCTPKEVNHDIKTEQSVAQWTLAQITQNSKLIIQATPPFLLQKVMPVIYQANKVPTIYVVSSNIQQLTQANAIIYRKQSDFINPSALKWLINHANLEKMNSSEISQLMMGSVWLELTQTGLYEQLNSEHRLSEVINRYFPVHIKKRKNKFYDIYLQSLSEATQLYVTIEQFKFFMYDTIIQKYIPSFRRLVIEDLQHWLQNQLFDHKIQWNMSQLFITFQQSFELFAQWRNQNVSLLSGMDYRFSKKMMRCVSLFKAILSQFETIIQQQNDILKSNDTQYAQLLDVSDQRECLNLLQQLGSLIEELIAYLETNLIFNQNFYKLCQQLKTQYEQLKIMYDKELLWIVTCQCASGHIYDFSLIISQPVFSKQVKQWLASFKEQLFINCGLQNTLNAQLLYPELMTMDYQIKSLPEFDYPKLSIKIPFDFLSEVHVMEHDNLKVLSKSQKHAIISQIDFIDFSLNQLEDKLLILAPNKSAVEYTYRILSRRDISKNYSIHAEGITSGINKVMRQFEQTGKQVGIVSYYQYMNNYFGKTMQNMTVVIQSLPFKSFRNLEAQVMKQSHQWSNSQLFDEYLLDVMQQDFSNLIYKLYSEQSCEVFYLFDERLYTRYYSAKLRENLEKWLNLIICD